MLTSGITNLLKWIKEQGEPQREFIDKALEASAKKTADNFLNGKSGLFSNIKTYLSNRNLANENVDLENLDVIQSLENMITGNYDYARTAELQNQAQAFNALEAQKARDYNTEMSNTAYQRQVADLEAAGLNPAVALGTSGASVGHVASASSTPRSYAGNDNLARLFGNLTNVLLGTLNSAVQTNNLDKKIDVLNRELNIKNDSNRLKASELAWKKAKESRYYSTPYTDKAWEIFNRLYN